MADTDPNRINISIKSGVNKETKREWKGVLIEIGEWSQLIFPRTSFEMKHIEKVLEGQAE